MIYNDKINVAYITLKRKGKEYKKRIIEKNSCSYSDCIAKYDTGGSCLGGR